MDELGITGELLGVDVTDMSPAFHVVDKAELVCPIADDDYIPSLLRLCREQRVGLLVPLLDTELPKISESVEKFQGVGTFCLVSDPKVIEIARDKRRTCEFFLSSGVDTPRILCRGTGPLPASSFPVFVKPIDGSGSTGARKVADEQELSCHLRRYPDCIVMECLEGDEYTLDVLADLGGRVRCVVPRLRIEVRAGEVSKGMTVKNRQMIETAKMAVERLGGCKGPITLQCFLTKQGRLAFTEINPRFGGGHPLAIAAGANFPEWILQMVLGGDPGIALDGFAEGLVMLRYDAEVFVARPKGKSRCGLSQSVR